MIGLEVLAKKELQAAQVMEKDQMFVKRRFIRKPAPKLIEPLSNNE